MTRISPQNLEVSIEDLADFSCYYQNAAEAVDRAVVAVEVAISRARFPLWLDRHAHMKLRRDLPYVIHDTALPRTQILVNRYYKPLGSNLPDTSQRVLYEDYPQAHIHLTDQQIAALVCPPHERGLFDDGCAPWLGPLSAMAYLKRLRLLYGLLQTAP